jgi:glycosyltransferase involved in cell wall biosynthesis
MNEKLSLCMIVRDEADNIAACLQSVIPYVDEMIVVDTGSLDDTSKIATELGAKVYHYEWRNDFAAARNYSLKQASGDWILYLDADERLESGSGPELRRLLSDPDCDGYFLLELNHFTENWEQDFAPHITPRLFRNRPEHRFTGRIHEMLDPKIFEEKIQRIKQAYQIRLHHYGYMIHNSKLPQKISRNLDLLMKEIALHPDDPFINFNLGTEYFRMQKFAEALPHYLKARELTPRNSLILPRLIKNIVIALIETGRFAEAKRHIWRGLLDLPDFNDLYYFWGELALKENQPTLALQCYAECQFLLSPPPHYNSVSGLETYRANIAKARCYRILNQSLLEALELTEAVKLNPDSTCRRILEDCLLNLTLEEQARVSRISH